MKRSLLLTSCVLALGTFTSAILASQEVQAPAPATPEPIVPAPDTTTTDAAAPDAPAAETPVTPPLQNLSLNLFEADDKNIQYTGRIDFSEPKRPRFSAPGVYIRARFFGPTCDVVINDEVLWGKSHNYIQIAVDNRPPIRVQLKDKTNTIRAAYGLAGKSHIVTICKDTEANIGDLEFVGFRCQRLLPLPQAPTSIAPRRIEFYGDSITAGMGSDTSQMACGTGEWYDQHNAYLAYGPVTARQLGAQWQLTAYSGIGLIHSCCDIKTTMPEIWDKVNLRTNSGQWDFKKYQPNVVTVCLGQNDGPENADQFRKTYVEFLGKLRRVYPKAQIVCLTSPMADNTLNTFLQSNLTQIVKQVNDTGDKKVTKFFFTHRRNAGCQSHPDVAEHQHIANELTGYLKTLMKW